MPAAVALTPFWPRSEHPAGQGFLSYAERNVRPLLPISPQAAPDPVRQGDTPARPSRMPIVVMSDPTTYGYWGRDDFIPVQGHLLTARMALARIPKGTSVNPVNERVNIYRQSAEAYGSLFLLKPQGYGYA